MKELLEYLLSKITDKPEAVAVEENRDNGRLVLSITADPTDIPRIIGKQGRIIHALRDLVKLVATKQNEYVDIIINEQNTAPEA